VRRAATASEAAAVAKLSTQSSYPGRLLLPRQRIDWSGIESSQAQNKELYGYTRRSKLGCSLHWGATDGTGSQLRKPRFTCTSRPTGKRERIGRLCSGPALRKLSVQTCTPRMGSDCPECLPRVLMASWRNTIGSARGWCCNRPRKGNRVPEPFKRHGLATD